LSSQWKTASARELEVGDGHIRDVTGNLFDVLLPWRVRKVGNEIGRHEGKSVPFGPLLKIKPESGVVVLFGWADFVQKRAFCDNSKVLRKKTCEKRP